MFEMVQNLSKKSWVDYSGPAEYFSRCNLLFGHNGQGKSALAEGIRELAVGETESPEAVRFFDRDYAQREMRLSNADGIKGVKVDFGQHNVDSSDELDDATKDRDSAFASLKIAEDKLTSARKAIEQRVKDIFSSTKGSAKIQAKKAALSPEDLVQAWINDYKRCSSRYPDFDYSSHIGDNKAEVKIEALVGVALPDFPHYNSDIAANTVSILRRSYESVDIPAPTVVSWMAEGVGLSEGRESCPFCGARISLDEIRSRVETYQKNEVVKAQNVLNDFSDQLHSISHFLTDARARGGRALALLPSKRVGAALREWLESDNLSYLHASDLLMEKVNDMNRAIDVDSGYFDFILDDFEMARALQDAIDAESENQQKIQGDLAAITKGSIGFKVESDQEISNALSIIASTSDRIKGLREEIGRLDKRIKELEDSKLDISAFADYLSSVLVDLGFPFSLETHKDGYYVLVLSDSQDEGRLSLRDISEGERNLLALLFFFYTLFTDENQSNLDKEIKAIVIDDPITSMDNINRFYVLELLRHIMRSRGAQIFVFTHSWDDFCELAYRCPENTSLFEVFKYDGASRLLPCKSSVSPYQKLFKEIYEFTRMTGLEDSFEDVALHMPNVMRRVLEEYLSFNCGVASVGSGNIQEIGEALFPEKAWAKVSQDQRGKLALLLSVTNLFSHKVSDKHDAVTVQKCASFLMSRIEAINRRHYTAMKRERYAIA